MSLYQIKVKTPEVLQIVKENKQKHDKILNDAIEGYWNDASNFLKKYEKDKLSELEKNHKATIKKMRKQLRENKAAVKGQVKKELELVEKREKRGYLYMSNKYPEDHGDDYIGTIRRLELSVDKEIELDTKEFDQYVRNKWEWRESFLNSNTGYANSYALSSSYSSHSNASFAITGSTWGTSSWGGISSYSNVNIGVGIKNPSHQLDVSNSSWAVGSISGSSLSALSTF